jgi:DNA-binding NarL/FixJ family response regulator
MSGNASSKEIRVLVVDDHPLVRRRMCALLASAGEIKVVGEAENGLQAISMTEKLNPDVIVMDISMPELDGIRATAEIRNLNPESRIVIVSMFASRELVEVALEKGADGYLLKRSTARDLIPAVRSVHSGQTYIGASYSTT